MTIGERVLSIIKEKGMSQKEFSDKTGIPQSTFTDWKNGKSSPKLPKLMKIANYFGVQLEDLIE